MRGHRDGVPEWVATFLLTARQVQEALSSAGAEFGEPLEGDAAFDLSSRLGTALDDLEESAEALQFALRWLGSASPAYEFWETHDALARREAADWSAQEKRWEYWARHGEAAERDAARLAGEAWRNE